MLKKTKVAFIIAKYHPAKLDGSEATIVDIVNALPKEKFECHIITSNGLNSRWWYDPIFGKSIKAGKEKQKKLTIYRLKSRHVFSFLNLLVARFGERLLPQKVYSKHLLYHSGPAFKGLQEVFEKERYDVVCPTPFPLYLNLQTLETIRNLRYKPKIVLRPCFHEFVKEYHNPHFVDLLNSADTIHVFTKAEKDALIRIFSVNAKKIAITPVGLVTKKDNHMFLTDKIKIFKKNHDLSNCKVILFAGSKIHKKGALTLLKSVALLYKKDRSYRLVAIGNSSKEWKEWKKTHKRDFLVDLNYVTKTEKNTAFSAADIVCLPSVCESFGVVYLEAWQHKKPVIGADIPVVREIISGAKGGEVVKFGSSSQLAIVIQKLAKNKAAAKQLGENGFRALQKNYTMKAVLPKLIKLYTV